MAGGDGSDRIFAGTGGIGDTVDGAESGAETDILDLTGGAPFRVIYDPLNPENGTVNFLDAQGKVLGTLTFTNIERVVVCFTPGTRIGTAKGVRLVERLKIGELVRTRDHGLQPIRWIGSRSLRAAELLADPSLQPIRIGKGALGQGLPLQDMRVARQHRMLHKNPQAELLFGKDEVMVRAQHLTHLPGIEAEQVADAGGQEDQAGGQGDDVELMGFHQAASLGAAVGSVVVSVRVGAKFGGAEVSPDCRL